MRKITVTCLLLCFVTSCMAQAGLNNFALWSVLLRGFNRGK